MANPGVCIRGVCQGQTQVGRGVSTIPPPPQAEIHAQGAYTCPPPLLGCYSPGKGGEGLRVLLQDEATLGHPEKPFISPAHCP